MDINGMRVMSIDDNKNNLMMVEVFANKLGLRIDSYEKPLEAIEAAEKLAYDLVIVDYMMPLMDGVSFIKAFREIDLVSPVVMVTAVGDDQMVQLKALDAGATDFMSKPINYPVFAGRIKNLLKLKKAHQLIEKRAETLEMEVNKATAKIQEREHETLRVIGKTAEYKDPETGSHISRVAGYTKAIAKAYGLPVNMQDIFYYAAPLHDIGKVGIQDHILLKPGPLNHIERMTMMEHALIGFEILKNSDSEYLKAGGIIAFTHHEKFDGTGYPKGLKGHSIPLMGRIVAVADVFDALTTKRPYKDPWAFEAGLEYLQNESGSHFDPEVVAAFMQCMDQIRDIYETYSEMGWQAWTKQYVAKID